MGLRQRFDRFREYNEITNVGPVVRRYFVIGAFDGALTILGVVLGIALTRGDAPGSDRLIVAAGLSAAIALAVSSTVGAYEAERVEKKLDQRSIERAMLVELSQEHRDAFLFATRLSALVHGVAPLFAALVPIVPFLLVAPLAVSFWQATAAAIALTLGLLFAIGAYLGTTMRERIVVTGLRFAAAGGGTALGLWALGLLGVSLA